MIKAIETVYKGYRFRSRLEARWAVFFDALGLKWEYEAEGYEFSNGIRYLPDFYLPEFGGSGYFAEIKPEKLTITELKKAITLCKETKKNVLLLIGIPKEKAYEYLYFALAEWNRPLVARAYYEDVVITNQNNGGCYWSTGYSNNSETEMNWWYDDLKNAVTCAKQARFEFGETP